LVSVVAASLKQNQSPMSSAAVPASCRGLQPSCQSVTERGNRKRIYKKYNKNTKQTRRSPEKAGKSAAVSKISLKNLILPVLAKEPKDKRADPFT